MKTDDFPYLVIGLAEFLEKRDRHYPYPDSLRYSLNKLSVVLLSDYPKTLDGLIQLFTKPLCTWWPGELPSEFEPNEPLIEDNEPSFEAMAYLERLSEQDNIRFQDSLSHIATVVDNRKFRQLLDRLRDISLTDLNGAQNDYITLRRFIIKHPYVLQRHISKVFSQTQYISTAEVSELYIKTNEIKDVLQYPNSDGHQFFWLCEHCGPLRVVHGQLESIKRSVCGKHCPRHQSGWKEVPPSNQLNVLRKGIHLRVHIPGIPELALFNCLEKYRQKYPKLIKDVLLWPRIDRYDLQIRFVDATWAIDIKDYEKPHQLARNLTNLFREGDLHWDKGFYVYPVYREKQHRNYGETVRLEARPFLKGIEIISDETFKGRVLHKLKSLKKGKP